MWILEAYFLMLGCGDNVCSKHWISGCSDPSICRSVSNAYSSYPIKDRLTSDQHKITQSYPGSSHETTKMIEDRQQQLVAPMR